MQKVTLDKESNLNTEAKTASQDFNKSEVLDERRNGTSILSHGRNPPIKEERRVNNFVDNIQKYYRKNPPGPSKQDGVVPNLKKLTTEQN